MNMYGLDLSEHNGNVDFQALKDKGNKFVILRCGYGSADNQKDKKFEHYYNQAKKHGFHVGAYIYGYALDTNGALQEAKACLKWLKGKQFDMPIYYDMEDADGYKKRNGMPSNTVLSKICETFCDYMEEHGYYVGIYASESWLDNQLKEVVRKNKFDLWVANWGTNDGTLQSIKSNEYKLHQFTSMYNANGKRYDRNVSYYDYPTLLKQKGFNGYAKNNKPTSKPNIIKVGSKVKVTKPINYDNGKTFALYYDVYDVIQIDGNRVVIGIDKTVTSAIDKKYLKLA